MTSELDTEFAALARRLQRSTVRVHDERGRGSGSGVVWDASGLIVTNAHVVRGRKATIEFPGGKRTDVDVVRRDDARDLAALRVPATERLAPVEVRAGTPVAPGELVVAVGNPLGLVGALTAGLVQRANARFVIADVRLEPGNSGGALADGEGRVVGINSMVANGLALAVPSAAVVAFLGGAVPRRLGVRLVPVAARAAGRRVAGLLIAGIDNGSIAQRAGLLLGDTIVATEFGAPPDSEQLAAALATATSLEIVRGGRGLRIAVPGASGASGEGSRAA